MKAARLKSRRKRVVIAGGGGFIGSHLCEAVLAEGHEVICIDSFLTGARSNIAELEDRAHFQLVEQDIRRPLRLDEPFDEIYNLASAASPPRYQADPIHTMMTNVLGCANLLALAEQHGARFLQASTSEVYGDPEVHPQPETYRGSVNCTGPRACYDEGKRAAEALCFDYLRLGRVDVRVARIFNTYGPRMQGSDGRIISNFISQALRGEPLTVYGSGLQTRSFCHVADLVKGLQALMQVEPNPEMPVNLGNPGEFTVQELAVLVRKLVPSAGEVVHHPLPEDDPQRRRPDIRRAKELLDWKPRIPLSQGLEETVRWFRTEGDIGTRKGGGKLDRSVQPEIV